MKTKEEIAKEWDIYHYPSGDVNNNALSAMEEYKNQPSPVRSVEEITKELNVILNEFAHNVIENPEYSASKYAKVINQLFTIPVGYTEGQVKALLSQQRVICHNIYITVSDDYIGCKEAILTAPEPSIPLPQSKITDEEIEKEAVDYVLVKFPKLRGYMQQVPLQESYIDGFKAALSLTSKEKEEWHPKQLCPKCHGDGNLSRYNSPAIITTSASVICDVCFGAKII